LTDLAAFTRFLVILKKLRAQSLDALFTDFNNFGQEFSMKNYRINFIRHGMTEANQRGVYVGRSDPELSPEGIRACWS